jgi:lipopolysaccharide export system protein LptA
VITLIGNVTLSRAGTVVTSQMGRYVKREGTIYLTGGVHGVDGRTRIDAVEAAYNEQNDFLTLTGSVVVRDEDMILTGDFGSYDQQQGRGELWSHVRGRDQGHTLAADRVTYFRDDGLAQARGRVTARDSVEALTLTADAVDYDKAAQLARATVNPSSCRPRRTARARSRSPATRSRSTRASAWRTPRARCTSCRTASRRPRGRAIYFDRENRGLLLDSPRASTGGGERARRHARAVHAGQGARAHARPRRGRDRLPGRRRGGPGEHAHRDGHGDVVLRGRDRLAARRGRRGEPVHGAPLEGRRPESNRTEGQRMRLLFRDKELQSAIVTGEAKGVYSNESALADTAAAARDRVEYEAGRITFEVPKNRIRLEDKAHLVYQDLSLRSPEVVFDSKKRIFEARGNPMLEDAGDTLTGPRDVLRPGRPQGHGVRARTRYETGWYTGEKIRRLGESVLDVQGATYSTVQPAAPALRVPVGPDEDLPQGQDHRPTGRVRGARESRCWRCRSTSSRSATTGTRG